MKYERAPGPFYLPNQFVQPQNEYWVTSSQNGLASGGFNDTITHTIVLPGTATTIFIKRLFAYAEFNDGTSDLLAMFFTIGLPAAQNQISILAGAPGAQQTSNLLYAGAEIELLDYPITVDASRTIFLTIGLRNNSYGPGIIPAAGDPIVTTLTMLIGEL